MARTPSAFGSGLKELTFRFNLTTGKITKGERDFRARAQIQSAKNIVIENVGIVAAERQWPRIKGQLAGEITNDVHNELNNIVRLFMRSIVGASGRWNTPRGNFSYVSPRADGFGIGKSKSDSISDGTGTWQPRSERYMARRRQREGHVGWPQWYERNPSSDTLQGMGDSGVWTKAFGPIQVRITRPKKITGENMTDAATERGYKRLGGVKGGFGPSKFSAKRIFNVARIEVGALRRITPENLGGFEAGPDFRGMMRFFGKPIAIRLRGGPRVPARRTVQPFLWYFLNRAMPNAAFRRIQVGLGAKLNAYEL